MALMKDLLSGLIRTILLVLFCTSLNPSIGQELEKATLKELQEHVLIETNGSLYIPGEPLLVSLRCLDGSGEASPISQVAYLELIDEEKNSILKAISELQGGKGSASIYLPSYLKTGNYVLIAYTSWMKNYPNELIPQKRLSLVNPYNPIPDEFFSKEDQKDFEIDMAPVSGGITWEEENQIAFHIQFSNGQPVRKIQGQIANKQGEIITSFDVQNGAGFFKLRPQQNEDYRLILVDAAGQVSFHPFAFSQESKGQMEVSESGGTYSFGSESNLSLKSVEGGNVVEVIGSGQEVSVSQEKLNPGINWIVSTTNNVQQASTPLFQKVVRKPATVSLEGSVFKPRSEAKLTIELPANDNDIGYTISVQKKSPLSRQASLAHQFFAQGWELSLDKEIEIAKLLSKRYSNTSITSYDSPPQYLPDLRSQMISGVLKGKNAEALSEQSVSVSFPTVGSKFIPGTTNESGQFFLQMDPIAYNGEMIFYAEGTDSESYMEIADPFLENHDFVIHGNFLLSESDKDWILERSVAIQIANAYYGEGETKPLSALLKSDFLSKEGFKSYDLDDFTRFPTVEDAVREFVAEAWLRQTPNGAMFTMPYTENKSGSVDTVLTLLNGIPIEPDYILKLNPLSIDKIELYQRQLRIGAWEYRGIINFQLYEFDSDQTTLPASYRSFVANLAAPYSASNNQVQHNKRIPDFRSQLYWNPDYQSDGNKEELTFFTSDQEGVYEVTVSGVVDGQSFILEKRSFEVRSENF